MVLPEEKLRDGSQALFADARGGDQLNQAVGVAIGQGLQKDFVDDREKRRYRADAEGEHSNGGNGEARVAPEGAGGELELVGQGAQECHR